MSHSHDIPTASVINTVQRPEKRNGWMPWELWFVQKPVPVAKARTTFCIGMSRSDRASGQGSGKGGQAEWWGATAGRDR